MVKDNSDLSSIVYENLSQIFKPEEIYVKGKNGINNIVLFDDRF